MKSSVGATGCVAGSRYCERRQYSDNSLCRIRSLARSRTVIMRRGEHFFLPTIVYSSIIVCIFCCHSIADASFKAQDDLPTEEDSEKEEKLVIEKLASIIHNQQQKKRYDDYQTDDTEYDYENTPSEKIIGSVEDTVNEPASQRASKVLPQPSIDDTGQERIKVDAQLPIQTKVHRTDPSTQYENKFQYIEPKTKLSDDLKNSPERWDQTDEDSVQRKKLYSYLTQNPSFIPYSHSQSAYIPKQPYYHDRQTTNILAITYGSVCGILVITIFGALLFYRKLKKKVKDAEEVDYPAYGVTGPNKEVTVATGDRHLAHSAQMYHYQHQKQQIKAMENNQKSGDRRGSESASDEDDFTVYECPGLATTGEMEVKNPMFQDEEEDANSGKGKSKETGEKKNGKSNGCSTGNGNIDKNKNKSNNGKPKRSSKEERTKESSVEDDSTKEVTQM